MKLIKQLKLTSLILVIAFCVNPQITFALDVNVTSDTGTTVTNTVTLGNFTNSATITTSGGDNGVQNSGTITTFTNSGTIIGADDGITNTGTGTITSLINSGRITGADDGITNTGTGTITSLINSGRITGTFGVFNDNDATLTTFTNTGTTAGSTTGFLMFGLGKTTNVINSGTFSGTINAIRVANGGTLNLTLNKGSVLIGNLHADNTGTLNITSNVGASKSYAYRTAGIGTITLNDLNNRPAVKGSALAINIGSMEMVGENLYQKTANITDAVDRNVKNNKDTWVEPYYSESTRDSGGDSSQIRQFKNNKQGVNAGFKVANSATPLQFILNVDQTKNNIDSSEHIINSDSVMIGLTAPSFAKYEGFDVSVKGLVGYANSKTDRKVLDNTSSTGERTLTGEYDSYYAVVGSALTKNYNLAKDLNNNITLGIDLTSEFRDSYNENLYFKYNSLNLVQLQPKIQSEFVKTTGKDSNVFLTAGVGAREVLSGKTQKYSMNNTGVSFTTPNSGDYYASLAAGANINVAANVNFTALVSAKMSEKETETYQASIGLKGTF